MNPTDRLDVLIERNVTTKIPVNVPAYELPVLVGIHGPSAVHVQNDGKATPNPRAAEDFDEDVAYEKLIAKYGQEAVMRVYQGAYQLAEKTESPKGKKAKPE